MPLMTGAPSSTSAKDAYTGLRATAVRRRTSRALLAYSLCVHTALRAAADEWQAPVNMYAPAQVARACVYSPTTEAAVLGMCSRLYLRSPPCQAGAATAAQAARAKLNAGCWAYLQQGAQQAQWEQHGHQQRLCQSQHCQHTQQLCRIGQRDLHARWRVTRSASGIAVLHSPATEAGRSFIEGWAALAACCLLLKCTSAVKGAHVQNEGELVVDDDAI